MIPTRTQIERVLYPVHVARRVPELGEPGGERPSPASVLVPIDMTRAGPRLLLTVRRDHLKTHAGQVSFPGGRQEPGDAGPVSAALREAEEETGIGPYFVEVAGLLDRHHTVTGFVVTPVVGFLRPGFRLRRQPEEVEELFWMPLGRALDPDRYARQSMVFRGTRREFHSQSFQGRDVWGATAAILIGLGEKIRNEREELSDDAV